MNLINPLFPSVKCKDKAEFNEICQVFKNFNNNTHRIRLVARGGIYIPQLEQKWQGWIGWIISKFYKSSDLRGKNVAEFAADFFRKNYKYLESQHLSVLANTMSLWSKSQNQRAVERIKKYFTRLGLKGEKKLAELAQKLKSVEETESKTKEMMQQALEKAREQARGIVATAAETAKRKLSDMAHVEADVLLKTQKIIEDAKEVAKQQCEAEWNKTQKVIADGISNSKLQLSKMALELETATQKKSAALLAAQQMVESASRQATQILAEANVRVICGSTDESLGVKLLEAEDKKSWTILCKDGGVVKIHRAVLTVNEFLMTALQNKAKFSGKELRQFDFTQYSRQTVQDFVSFLYTERTRKLFPNDLLKLYQLADYVGHDKLKALCLSSFEKAMQTETTKVFEELSKEQLNPLMQKILTDTFFIHGRPNPCFKSSELLQERIIPMLVFSIPETKSLEDIENLKKALYHFYTASDLPVDRRLKAIIVKMLLSPHLTKYGVSDDHLSQAITAYAATGDIPETIPFKDKLAICYAADIAQLYSLKMAFLRSMHGNGLHPFKALVLNMMGYLNLPEDQRWPELSELMFAEFLHLNPIRQESKEILDVYSALFKKLNDSAHPTYQMRSAIAHCYRCGIGVEANPSAVWKVIEDALAQKILDSKRELDDFHFVWLFLGYYQVEGGNESYLKEAAKTSWIFDLCLTYVFESRIELKVKKLEEGAKRGLSIASYWLSHLYEQGAKGLNKDPALAFKYGLQVTQIGFIATEQLRVAQFYLNGQGTEKNVVEARRLALLAHENGVKEAQNFIQTLSF